GGVRELPRRRAVALTGRPAGNRVAAGQPDGGGGLRGPGRAGGARGPVGDRLVVRVPRRLPPEDALGVKRELPGGFEVDDDRGRVDVEAVHDFVSNHPHWAPGRAWEEQERLVQEAARVVGLYDADRQIGFARAVSDGASVTYLADVYVLPEYRGQGLGVELIREMIEHGPLAEKRWILHTKDAHSLYEKFVFGAPSERVMERPRRVSPLCRGGVGA